MVHWGTLAEAEKSASALQHTAIAPTAYNWVAVVALALAPLTLGTLGIPVAIAALYVARRGWATNRKTAIWALLANITAVLVSVGMTVFAGWFLVDRAYTEFTNPRVLRQGHCVAEPSSNRLLAALDVVPCDEPHWGQIYTTGLIAWGTGGSTSTRHAEAEGRCLNTLVQMEELEPVAAPDNVYVFVIEPSRRSRFADTTYVCVVITEETPLRQP